jgi:hypothetical protein
MPAVARSLRRGVMELHSIRLLCLCVYSVHQTSSTPISFGACYGGNQRHDMSDWLLLDVVWCGLYDVVFLAYATYQWQRMFQHPTVIM